MRKRFDTRPPREGEWGWYDDPEDSSTDPWYWRWWDGKQWRQETKTRPMLLFRVNPNVSWIAFITIMLLALIMLIAGSVDNISTEGVSHEGDPMLAKSAVMWIVAIAAFVWAMGTSIVRTPPKNPHTYID